MYRAAEYLIEAGHAYVDEQSAEEMRANRGDFTQARAPTAPFRDALVDENLQRFARCATASSPTAPRAAREDRHGVAQHQHARPGDLPHQAPTHHAPATSGASTRCTPTRTRSRTRWRTSRTRSARWSSRTSGRSTTGCWTRLAEGGLLKQPLPQQIRVRAAEPHLRVTSKRKLKQLVDEKARRRLGRPAHADHRRPAPPRLHAREHPAVRRAHRREQGDSWIDYSTLEARCATTWTRRRRARWRCWTR
jgi:glutaminyl-tRNA synthetase